MNTPEISVIIPTYNRAKVLSTCIDAILAQDYTNFELIIVDDGSSDNTLELLQKYQYQLHIISQENRGVSSARNAGIAKARGKYLAFCDSDDIWMPKKLSIQHQFFQNHPEALVCYTNEIWIRHGRRVNPCRHHAKISGWIFEPSLELCLVSPSSVMMHHSFFELVGTFDEDLPACEDYDLWLRAAHVMQFYCIPEPLIIKYGGHEDQLSKKFWGMDRFRIQAILKSLNSGKLNKEQHQQAIQVLCKKCKILAEGAYKRNNLALAQEYKNLFREWEQKLIS